MKNFTSAVNKLAITFYFFVTLAAATSVQLTAQIQTDVPALKNVYANDFYFGCILSYRHVGFKTDPSVPGQSSVIDTNGGYLVKFHMNSMTPGNNMKPENTVDISASASAYNAASASDKDSVDVHPTVRFKGDLIAQLNWAKRQGFVFRGHTLVWHNQTPGTGFFRKGYSASGERLTKERMTERMDNYIKEVIRLLHEGWPGLVAAMDVVNEAVNEDGTDRKNNNEWYTTFGDNSYVMKAFEIARKYTVQFGETQMKLYYNDYNTHSSSKANGIVRICGPIFRSGVLDGIGLQNHNSNTSPTADQFIASYNKYDTICTEMSITELDVSPGSGTPTLAALMTQANQYAMLFKCFIDRSYRSGRGKIVSVTKDGLNDQYAYVANASLWDNRNQCKPAFYSSANVGINYNILDSLIACADTLQASNYSPESWASLSFSLASAKNTIAKNYSASVSADTALSNAKDNLKAAIDGLIITSTSAEQNHIKAYMLAQNYPNPFNPTTTISFEVPVESVIKIKVYDILGREVAILLDELKPSGRHTLNFDASRLSSGTYIYSMEAGTTMLTKTMLLLK